MKSPIPFGFRNFRTVLGYGLTLGLALSLALGLPSRLAAAQGGYWEKYSSESFTLKPKETFQFHVTFAEIPVRVWKLVVDGGDWQCDLSVFRVRDDAILYYKIDERHHEVLIPWGQDEEVMVAITARSQQGNYVVDIMGPPKGQVQAAYSYHVNRALEAYGSGQTLKAQAECETAIQRNPDDAVAKVLLAGFLKEDRFYGQADQLVDEALAGDLPADMRQLAVDLKGELAILLAPLAPEIVQAMTKAEEDLNAGRAADALGVCDDILAGTVKLDGAAKGQFEMLRGRALDSLDRNFEAVDAYTRALHLTSLKSDEAVIYFYMGRLFLKMENLQQAQGAYTMALQYGLPTGLDLQAREDLVQIEKRLQE